MTRQTIYVGAAALSVNLIDPPLTAMRLWSIASGLARDEITEAPPASRLSVRVLEPHLGVNDGDDGSFCIVGWPWSAFPPLLAPSYPLNLTLSAPGYASFELRIDLSTQQRSIAAPAPASGDVIVALNDVSHLDAGQVLLLGPADKAERRVIANLGPGAQQVTLDSGLIGARAVNDPVVADAWTPADLGVIGLRRRPITLHGRAVHRDAATNTDVPVANATIAVTDFWWTLASFRTLQPGSMTQPNPALRAFALGVEPGVYAARAAGVGVGQLAELALQSPSGDDHLLMAAANAGDTTIRVSDRQLLTPGTLLRIDSDQADIAETLRIAGISGWGAPDQPGVATLAFPLRNDHRVNARVVRVLTPFPPGPNKALRREAAPGDRCVFVSDLAGLATNNDVQITGGTAPDEHQRIALLTAVSDADGYFRFPALHRIAALRLHATAAALAALDFEVQPDYGQLENWLDVVFA